MTKKKTTKPTAKAPKKKAGNPASAAPSKPKAAKKKTPATKPTPKSGKKKVSKAAPKPKAAKNKSAKASKKTASKSKQPIPAILLEGDRPRATPRSGPGSRYELGPDASKPHGGSGEEPGDLPDGYGTGMLVATARDPHWLYIFWDLTDSQLRSHNKASRDRHLILRLFTVNADGITSETHVHPESRNWFVPVPQGGRKYSVELGYYDQADKWQSVSISRPVATPPDSLADDDSADFATLPVEIPFEQLIATVRQIIAANVPLMEALEQLRAEGYDALPATEYFKRVLRDAAGMADVDDLTAEQKEALADVITMDEVRRVWVGSHEITELVKKQLVKELASQAAAAVGGARAISIAGVSSLSSPFGGGPSGAPGFWFNVNAELIIYGATEPDATVTIGERKIQLRGDGTFSYRFSLPDGQYDLPIQATSAAGDDSRQADLAFSRDTQYQGKVDTHPQDEGLKTPRPENTA